MLALIFATQGLAYLALRTNGEVQNRAKNLLGKFAIADTVLVAVAALWGQFLYASQAMAWIPLIIAALAFVVTVLMALRGSNGVPCSPTPSESLGQLRGSLPRWHPTL